MVFIFSTPVLIRYLQQFKTVVFLHWCPKLPPETVQLFCKPSAVKKRDYDIYECARGGGSFE
jgi:hypothetical protein